MTPPPITFDPPLPCSALGADGVSRCAKPATVGTLYPTGGGQYLLQPICRDCVQAIRWMYIDQAGERPTHEDVARRREEDPDVRT